MSIFAIAMLIGITQQYQQLDGEIGERLNKPVFMTLTSKKKIYDLELCVADAFSKLGVATIFRDGPSDIQMMINGGGIHYSFLYSVSFNEGHGGTTLSIRALGDNIPEKYLDRAKKCL